MDLETLTTVEDVATYEATNDIFKGLITEIRELSKKKPEATLSKGKVKLVNRVLVDLKSILENEPEGKFIDLLEDEELPQNSDAVLVMVQYETALLAYFKRYYKKIDFGNRVFKYRWMTPEFVEFYEGN